MEFIKPGTRFAFLKYRFYAFAFSGVIILASVLSLVLKGGPKYGIDFAGGVLMQVKFSEEMKTAEFREALMGLDVGQVVVQQFGEKKDNEFLVRVEKTDTDLSALEQKIGQDLKERFGKEGFQIERTEIVGPKVGADLRRKGFLALLYSLLGILAYVAWRFEFRFGLGAVAALIHDAVVVVGVFSILNKEIDLGIIAAVLTIIGYSVNDTIVVFDRVRENMRKIRKQDLEALLDGSVSETLGRTLITSGTVLIATVSLFFLGGPVIHDFAFALTIGVLVGCYSTIYISSPVVLYWERFRARILSKTAPAKIPARRQAGR